jgi:hypothetical protein
MTDGEVLAWRLIAVVALIALISMRPRRRPRNKRTGLPIPRPDDRSSIEQFKRMHQP